jgi:hypothetical protein
VAVADSIPPPGAIWRGGGTWSLGLIIGHNDTAPYNAAWRQDTQTGFFDWDFAGPATPEWDLAFAGFSWVPCTPGVLSPLRGCNWWSVRRVLAGIRVF